MRGRQRQIQSAGEGGGERQRQAFREGGRKKESEVEKSDRNTDIQKERHTEKERGWERQRHTVRLRNRAGGRDRDIERDRESKTDRRKRDREKKKKKGGGGGGGGKEVASNNKEQMSDCYTLLPVSNPPIFLLSNQHTNKPVYTTDTQPSLHTHTDLSTYLPTHSCNTCQTPSPPLTDKSLLQSIF